MTAVVAGSQERLRQLAGQCGRLCAGRKLRVSDSKSKVMMLGDTTLNVALSGGGGMLEMFNATCTHGLMVISYHQ